MGEREGPSETLRVMSQSPQFIELLGRLHAITQKLSIKRLQEAFQQTLGIDIPEANFISGAVAPASLSLSCLLWNFTATRTFAQYAPALCFTSVICHPFLSEA